MDWMGAWFPRVARRDFRIERRSGESLSEAKGCETELRAKYGGDEAVWKARGSAIGGGWEVDILEQLGQASLEDQFAREKSRS